MSCFLPQKDSFLGADILLESEIRNDFEVTFCMLSPTSLNLFLIHIFFQSERKVHKINFKKTDTHIAKQQKKKQNTNRSSRVKILLYLLYPIIWEKFIHDFTHHRSLLMQNFWREKQANVKQRRL